MDTRTPIHFDHRRARAHCLKLRGLQWDEALAAGADKLLWEAGMGQEDFDRLACWYADTLAVRMNPRSYTWRQRIALAVGFFVHFIANPKGM